MSTPQNELYKLSNNVRALTELFETEDDENSIFDNVKLLYLGHQDIVKRMERIEDQMALIIKLLTIEDRPPKRKI